ncbi:MAG: hypothetical protein Q8911_06480 [Bacillota bacterium]|nr:hypothetical protein [Bacillota bacterium]
MGKMKAVVLEKSGSNYTVLGQNGTFRQVYRRKAAEIGEEIEIRSEIEIFSGLRVWAGMAAVFLLVLTALFGWNLYQAPTAVALLSVDINPSVQFTIDSQGHVLKLQMENEDAKHMLSKTDLKGKSLDVALGQIVSEAIKQQFLTNEHHWVVLGYAPLTDKDSVEKPKELNQNEIMALVTEKTEQRFNPQVAVFDLDSQERELAKKEGLTLGEYGLWKTAQKAGVITRPEMLKETSERVRVLDNPQVQEQIKEGQKGRQDSGSIGEPKKEGTGKPPDKLSPSQIPNPMPERDKGQDDSKNKQKDSENNQQKDQRSENGQVESKEKVLTNSNSSAHRAEEMPSRGNNDQDVSKNDSNPKQQEAHKNH